MRRILGCGLQGVDHHLLDHVIANRSCRTHTGFVDQPIQTLLSEPLAPRIQRNNRTEHSWCFSRFRGYAMAWGVVMRRAIGGPAARLMYVGQDFRRALRSEVSFARLSASKKVGPDLGARHHLP